MSLEVPGFVEFGSFVLDQEAQRLFRCKSVSLAPRAEAILLSLADRPGEVVADTTLYKTWATNVEPEANLATQIKNLRRKVGDTEKEKVKIQRDTQKRGYRLVYDEMMGDLIRFGDFLLDRKTPRLWKAELVTLEPVLLRILTALAERPGEVVEERALLRRVLGNSVVAESGTGSSPPIDLTAEILRLNGLLDEGEATARIHSAAGFRLTTEPAGEDEPVDPSRPGWARRSMPWMVSALLALTLLGLVYFCRPEQPALTLSCAPVIETHMHRIFGTLRLREPDAAIVGFVRPDGERSLYYRQGLAKIDDDDWWLDARFGNEEGHDMVLPLHFRAFVVYVSPASLARELGATWQDPQVEAKSDQEFVERLRAGVEQQQGTFEVSNSCRIYRTASRDCSGHTPTVLHPTESQVSTSPVAFHWSGEKPMYLELRSNTSVIEIGGSPERPVLSGVEVDLETGKYHVKVSAQRSFTCPAIVWFDVAREESQEQR